MPKPHAERVTQLPTVAAVKQPVEYKVAAQVVNDTVIPEQDSELAGLVSGLATMNPALGRAFATGLHQEHENAKDAYRQGATAGAVYEPEELDPNKAILSPAAMPQGVEPAYTEAYASGFKASLGVTLGRRLTADMLSQWDQVKMQEGSDPEKFVKDFTAKAFAGITDPEVLRQIIPIHQEAVASVRGEGRKIGAARLQEAAAKNYSEALSATIHLAVPPEEMYRTYQQVVLPQGLALGQFTRNELNAQLLEHINSISVQAGGDPALFDVFTEYKDPTTGKSMAESNVELAGKVTMARKAAEAQLAGRYDKAMETTRTQVLMGIHRELAETPEAVTNDRLLTMVNHGLISGPQAIALSADRDKAMVERAALTHQVGYASNGYLGALPEKDQRKVIGMLTDPLVDKMLSALSAPPDTPGAQEAANAAAQSLVEVHSKAGTSIPNERLKGLFDSLLSAIPAKGAPVDPKFAMAAAVYRSLPPYLRPLYASEDAGALMDSYIRDSSERGKDTTSAYHSAYQTITPEAKAAAKEMSQKPEFKAEVGKWAKRAVQGFWGYWLPGSEALGYVPSNFDGVNQDAMSEAIRLKAAYPQRSDESLEAEVKQRVEGRWFHDKTNNVIVQAPQGMGQDKTLNEAYHAKVDQLKAKYGTVAEDSVVLIYDQYSQTYEPWLMVNGAPRERLPGEKAMTVTQLRQEYTDSTVFTPQERQAWALIDEGVRKGTLTPSQLIGAGPLIAKAKAIGFLPEKSENLLIRTQSLNLFHAVQAMPDIKMGRPTMEGIDNSRLPPNREKAAIASKFLREGNMAGALTAMGEGVVLQVYPDPAKGRNIGLGYNIDQNLETYREDFRKAGIPADKIDAIVEGKAGITTDQAVRLYTVVQPRYEAMAKAAVERIMPGVWGRLMPNQKAVMTDLAYQVGSADKSKAVDQFSKGLAMMLSGKLEDAAKHFGVSWRRRQDGQMVVDEHRNNLRSHMLQSPEGFDFVVHNVGRKPRNAAEALRLSSSQQQQQGK